MRPEAPSIELAGSPRLRTVLRGARERVVQTRFRADPHPFACGRVTRRRPTNRAPTACYPAFRGFLRPPWALTRSCRLRPRTRPGKMLRFDFCNRLAWHVHQPNRSTLEVTRGPLARRRHVRRIPTGAFGARRWGVPANSSSHEALDGASRASVVELHPPRASACDVGCGPILRVLDRKGPRSAPPSERRCLPRPGRAPLPLTPLATTSRAEALPAAGCVLPLGPVKERGLERTRAPSIDRCPLGPALARLTSNADPPPTGELCRPRPASDAPSRARPSR